MSLTPEERQMVADAERSVKLQGAATEPPWKVIKPGHGHETKYRCVQFGKDERYASLEQLKEDCVFIAASRTDPSAANVLTLAETVMHLRNENAELYELAAKLRVENAALRKRLEGT